jgi:cleavage stimulation factor subunit 3
MRFGRRVEGQSSRAIFGKARKCRWTPWETYEAAGETNVAIFPFYSLIYLRLALLEYHCNKAMDVASRIFEKGMATFGEEIEYVLRYLGFLISVNDENS